MSYQDFSYQGFNSRPRGFGWGPTFDDPEVDDQPLPDSFFGIPFDWNGLSPAINASAAGPAAGSPPSVIEPPPSGYPKIIVHPERPEAAFALLSPGWYRSPTGEVVSYKTVADYLLTAEGVDQLTLLKALGQVRGNSTGIPVWGVVVGAVALGLLLIRR